ncbi:MAG: hypothetical protein AAFR38_00610 [Planctomycetota bacterium]
MHRTTLALSVVAAAGIAHAQPSFRLLGDLPGGTFDSEALDVTDDGTTVVGRSRTATGTRAFRWTQAQGMRPLVPSLPAGFTSDEATDIDADGDVIAGQLDGPGIRRMFYWTPARGMRIPVFRGGETESIGGSVSGDGVFVGGISVTPADSLAYRFRVST